MYGNGIAMLTFKTVKREKEKICQIKKESKNPENRKTTLT